MRTQKFDPGLDIRPQFDPLGFRYGADCFGPMVENRSLNAIRASLRDPVCEGPDIVYSIAMDVGKNRHRALLKEMHLLYGAVSYASGSLGEEPIRSQGHIHKKSTYANGWSTPEVYEIWSGRAIIYMQERAEDNPGNCYAVHAAPGEIVIVPPGWAHATISADPDQALSFGAWCDREYGFEYAAVRERSGLAWYPLLKNGKIRWQHNGHYARTELIEKKPERYTDFNVVQGIPIYTQFEKEPEKFLFVPKPAEKEEIWRRFVP